MKKVIFGLFLIVFCMVGSNTFSQEELKTIKLSEPELNRGMLLMQALKERKSQRNFSNKEIPLNVLSNLLWAARGINRPDNQMLTAPSAHNAQEIDIYVATREGLFLYNPKLHILLPILNKDIRASIGKQSFTKDAPVGLVYVSNLNKLKNENIEGRKFYSATDTGFISQNVYLFCASEGLSTVVLGWIDRPALSKLMELEDHQAIILTQPVGYPE